MWPSFAVALKRISMFALLVTLALSGTAARAGAKTNQPPPAPYSSNYAAWLNNQVRHALVMLPYFSVFDNLQYRVDGSKVTLMGQVARPQLKYDAANAVKRMEGVQSVDNQIEVLPTSPLDDQIRRAEFRAIYGTTAMEIYRIRSVPPIHIIVKNGHVTLEGVVANPNDKNIAGLVANQVPNVFSVINNLRVENS